MNVPPPDLETPFAFTPGFASGKSGGVSGDGVVPQAARSGNVADDPVRRSQRQIGAALQEIAVAARASVPPSQFIAQALDRTLQVLVAQGTLWFRWDGMSLPSTKPIVTARRGGVTDQTLGPQHRLAISDLVAEVLRTETPAVIPPTPVEHWDPSTMDLINPTEFPLAVVPILAAGHAGSPQAIGVFLESGGSIATQRGYLRFIAQVADLAAGFLEVHQGRQMHRQLAWSEQIDQQCEQLASVHRSIDIRDRMVDVAASVFQFDHVALCRVAPSGGRTPSLPRPIRGKARKQVVVSISHCETIDQHGAAVDRLVDVVERAVAKEANHGRGDSTSPSSMGTHAAETGSYANDSRDSQSQKQDPLEDHSSRRLLIRDSDIPTNQGSSSHSKSSDAVHEVFFLGSGRVGNTARSSSARWMVIASCNDGEPIEEIALPTMNRWLRHTHDLARVRGRLESSWLVSLLASSATAAESNGATWRRRFAFGVASAVLIAAMLVVPISQKVTSPAVLVPADVQTVYGPRSAMVETIHVDHEQPVSPGDPLITLRSPELDDQILQLRGRGSVLNQRRVAIASDLVSSRDPRRQEQLQDDQRLLNEQIEAVTAELNSLTRMQEQLVLRSRVAGTVDAWQIRQTLDARPITRGDLLLRVLPEQADWWVLASVPPSAIPRLTRAAEQDNLVSGLRIDGSDHSPVPVLWDRLGPAAEQRHQVRFRLPSNDLPRDEAWRTEASGQVEMNCGKVPLADWLWGDSIRWARQQFQMVMGGAS